MMINACGLEGSLRNENDGFVFFGNELPNEQGTCDYVFKRNDESDIKANLMYDTFIIIWLMLIYFIISLSYII